MNAVRTFEAALPLGVPPCFATHAALLASILVACADAVRRRLARTRAPSPLTRGRRRGPAAGTHAARRRAAAGGTIAAIKVVGNQRIETGTILSYMLVQPGDPFDPDRLDRSLKTLYATGLFSDVRLRRDGDTLVVTVVENPIVNRIAFEGNHKLNDDDAARRNCSCSRAPCSRRRWPQADRQRILDALCQARPLRRARSSPKIIELARTASTWCSRSTRAPRR